MKALYIHIPFCKKKCFYCSFAIAVAQEKRIDEYLTSLEQEMCLYQGEQVKTIYLGGGTPSHLSSHQFEYLITSLNKSFRFSKDLEWTVELNPESVQKDKIKLLLDYGVNRFSLGVQTFHDHYLKYLGRNHDQTVAKQALCTLRSLGVDNISIDLMFGFPQQSNKELEQDLHMIREVHPDHVSLYALTVDPHSRFFANQVALKGPSEQARLYQKVVQALNRFDYKQYEISNFAKSGYASKHNQIYWRRENYIGLGMSAHSFINGYTFSNNDKLLPYLRNIKDKGHAKVWEQKLTVKRQLEEALFFGLRMNEGVDLHNLERRFNRSFDKSLQQQLNILNTEGLLEYNHPHIKMTDNGRVVLDEVCKFLMQDD